MICPEIEGGLPVPRHPCKIVDNRVINNLGQDKTLNFIKGAQKALQVCKEYKIKKAILKEKSPSCGTRFIYDGTFSKKLIPGRGITARLLEEEGIEVISDEDF